MKEKDYDRRLFPRYTLSIPVRYRGMDFSTDLAEHTTEAVNVSRNGLLLTSKTPLRLGMGLDMTLRMPVEISGMTNDGDALHRADRARAGHR